MSEFVFGTHNAAFVQVMYEQYLRDPASVGEDWRQLFDNGRLMDLPVIPTTPAEALRDAGSEMRDATGITPAAPPHPASPILSPGLTPITGPAARLVQNMTDSLSVPTATSFREIVVDTLDARRRELNARLAAGGKKISYTHLIGYAIVQAARAFPVMTHAFRDLSPAERDSLRPKLQPIRQQLMDNARKAHEQIEALLTPEQRQKLEKHMREHEMRGGPPPD